jgi:hypothetical protein
MREVRLATHGKGTVSKCSGSVKRSGTDTDSTSVADPDPHVFGPPGSGSISQMYGSATLDSTGTLFFSFFQDEKIK